MIPTMENKIAEKIVRLTVDDIGKVDPETGTMLGNATQGDVWNAPGGGIAAKRLEIFQHYSELMKAGADFSKLTPHNKAMARLLEYAATRQKGAVQFLDYANLINPVDGPQVRLPLFLVTQQPASTTADFKNYIARMKAFAPYVQAVIALTKSRRAAGIRLPAAGMASVAAQCRALTTGKPFSATGAPSPLLDDFDTRVRLAHLDAGLSGTLEHEAANALVDSVGPACKALSTYAMSIASNAAPSVASLPQGPAFYTERLAWFTSTGMSARDIHQLAIQQMSDVMSAIEDAMGKEGFEGSPAQFMDKLRRDKAARIATGDKTMQKWLNKIGSYVFALDASLDHMLSPQPDTDLDIRAMESFQQPSGVAASYYSGRTLGIYYVNLAAIPQYEVEAMTYRYTIPGEHAIPMSPLNRIVTIPAFSDGWSLYSLTLPVKYDYYREPRTALGRLLVTATAIAEGVVDTGLNAAQWDRSQATEYLLEHSPITRAQAAATIDRILDDPGRATAAVVGAATIERLRRMSEKQLGKGFSSKAFNSEVLRDGPIPMPLLEQNVNQWLKQEADEKTSNVKQ